MGREEVSTSASRRHAVERPPAADLLLLLVGVLGVSTSGPIIAVTAAPALAIAFWRNALAAIILTPVAALRHARELARMDRRSRLFALGAGAFLAGHFGLWVPSLSYTSVASSVALVCTQPVWAALIARARGQAIPGRAWLGIAVALAGVVVLTGVDLSLTSEALAGDLLALSGAVLGAAYVTMGSEVRRTVSTVAYTTICYGTAAALLLLVCLVSRQQLVGYEPETWLKLGALTVAAQFLGHSLFNVVLRTTSATVVSLVILFEVPGAAVIAAVWLGQIPPLAAVPAAALLLAGVFIVVGTRRTEPPTSDEVTSQ